MPVVLVRVLLANRAAAIIEHCPVDWSGNRLKHRSMQLAQARNWSRSKAQRLAAHRPSEQNSAVAPTSPDDDGRAVEVIGLEPIVFLPHAISGNGVQSPGAARTRGRARGRGRAMATIITVNPRGDDLYLTVVDGLPRWVSRTPFLVAARKLLALGYSPDDTIVMRHRGSEVDCLTSTIREAARLRVSELDDGKQSPTFRVWRPYGAGGG
jgi:hypothetical protein